MFIVQSGYGSYLGRLPLRKGFWHEGGSWTPNQNEAHIFENVQELLNAVIGAKFNDPILHWTIHEITKIPRPSFELTGKTL